MPKLQPVRSLGLISVASPLFVETQLFVSPVRTSWWHGLTRQTILDTLSVGIIASWIGHIGEVVEQYTVPLHVVNIDLSEKRSYVLGK